MRTSSARPQRRDVARNLGGRVTPEAINDVGFLDHLAENALPDDPLFEAAVIDGREAKERREGQPSATIRQDLGKGTT